MIFLKEFLDKFLKLVGIPFQILTPTREKALLWTLSTDRYRTYNVIVIVRIVIITRLFEKAGYNLYVKRVLENNLSSTQFAYRQGIVSSNIWSKVIVKLFAYLLWVSTLWIINCYLRNWNLLLNSYIVK